MMSDERHHAVACMSVGGVLLVEALNAAVGRAGWPPMLAILGMVWVLQGVARWQRTGKPVPWDVHA
jgi:ribose/xylose/arabinose/galactoside ABC-type transport system permease subunit